MRIRSAVPISRVHFPGAKRIRGAASISRVHCPDSDDYISIALEDEDARITFVEVNLDLAGFALALTGSSTVYCDIDVDGLENVGKLKEQIEAVFALPEGTDYSNERATALSMIDEIDDGWDYSTDLYSPDSFYSDRSGRRRFKTIATRWVDSEEFGK